MSSNNKPSLSVFKRFDALILIYVCFGLLLAWSHNLRLSWDYLVSYEIDLQFITVVLFSLYVFIIFSAINAWRTGEDRELCGKNWRRRLRCDYLSPQHLVDAIRVLIQFKLVLLAYSSIKQAIPLINPRIVDNELLGLDLAVHFGLNPMNVYRYGFSSHAWMRFFDLSYFSWYYMKAVLIAVFVIVKDRDLHVWFFRAFFTLWMFGGLCALLLPSLGPVYMWKLWYGSDLINTIDAPIAQGLQSQLWEHYSVILSGSHNRSILAYEGIAAFPSLHVAIAALATLFLFQLGVWPGMLMLIYAILIQLASVILGWHYAIDGYFGAVLAYALYVCTRPKTKRRRKLPIGA